MTFENARDAIIWIDGETFKIVNCNHSAETLLGCKRPIIVGTPAKGLFNENAENNTLKDFKELASGRGHSEREFLINTSAGDKTVLISASVTDVGGKGLIQIILRDITQQKTAESERIRLEQQLHQAQKMEAIGRLAGGIAHDFNNILGAISGYADMIRLGSEEKHRKYAITILSASERAADLISKLLAFARRGNLEMESVDVQDIIDDALKLLEHSIDKRITLITDFKAGHATIQGSKSQIQNVIINLALNAQDAMPQGGTMTIQTHAIQLDRHFVESKPFKVAAGSYLHLSITDTGAGMDQQTKVRLFEPFFTTKEPGRGTGLGLASVYGTVKSHNGFIEVESEPGKGTRFDIFFPLTKSEVPAVMEKPVAMQHGAGTVLIVDDEEFIRQMAGDMLKDAGLNVVTCAGSREALEYYMKNQQSIDCVLLDIMMPEMDGFDLLRVMHQANKDIKAILMSGYSVENNTKKIYLAGAKKFLKKPFLKNDLLSAVFGVIGTGSATVIDTSAG